MPRISNSRRENIVDSAIKSQYSLGFGAAGYMRQLFRNFENAGIDLENSQPLRSLEARVDGTLYAVFCLSDEQKRVHWAVWEIKDCSVRYEIFRADTQRGYCGRLPDNGQLARLQS